MQTAAHMDVSGIKSYRCCKPPLCVPLLCTYISLSVPLSLSLSISLSLSLSIYLFLSWISEFSSCMCHAPPRVGSSGEVLDPSLGYFLTSPAFSLSQLPRSLEFEELGFQKRHSQTLGPCTRGSGKFAGGQVATPLPADR